MSERGPPVNENHGPGVWDHFEAAIDLMKLTSGDWEIKLVVHADGDVHLRHFYVDHLRVGKEQADQLYPGAP